MRTAATFDPAVAVGEDVDVIPLSRGRSGLAAVRRLTVVVVVLVFLAGGIGAVAVADHRHKNAQMGPANVASWYCQHRGQRCQEPQSERIEAAWQRREQVYRVSFLAVSLGGMTALAVSLRSRNR